LTNTIRARLLASSMITGVALAGFSGGAAYAADAPAAAPVQEIVVTGSRVPQKNLTSVSPLSVVDNKEIKFQGSISAETFLQNLPSVIPEYNQGVDNGASGTATVSLRGLGSKRTLVLVDGNRLMPGDPIVPSPDLNNIPSALIDHVEVITGGASAVYGSDAVGGVVNFVLKKNFEGIQMDAQYGFAAHQNGNSAARQTVMNFDATHGSNPIPLATDKLDAFTYTASVLLGVNAPDGKGNITAYLGYRNIQPLTQDRRDAGACGISSISTTSNTYDTQVCQGSSNSAFGKFVGIGPLGSNGKPTNLADNPDGTKTFVPYAGAFAFNFGPFNYYQQHDDLYTADFFAHYEVNQAFQVYSRFMFADDTQISNAAPSGLFSNSGPIYSISCNNPLASASQLAAICPNGGTLSAPLSVAYRFAGIPRVTNLQHTAYTATVGFKGDIGSGWSYDVHGQFGKTSFREVFTGDISIAKINNALDAIPGPGGPVCASGGSCVPLDIFQALGKGLTPASVAYVSEPALKIGGNTEQVVTASITGDLGTYGIKSPYASDGVGVAFGGEYRRDTLSLSVDNSFLTGDLSGSGGVNPPANGATNVKELFAEMRVPIAQDVPFAKLLTLETAYRFSHYNLSGDTNTYKISGEWEPIADIRFRGGYNRAVRAPNIVELFNPQTVGNNSFNDPCAGTTKLSFAACALTGVTAAEYGNVPSCAAAQCSSLTGGNPSLTPEKADTYTVGAVIRPHYIPGLSVTVDYFYIKIGNPISTIGGAVILSQCLAGQASFCSLIHRAPNTGALYGLTTNDGYVIDINQNTGHITTSGLDFGASYRLKLDQLGAKNFGSLDFTFNGTYTQKYETAPFSGSGTYDCAGYFGVVCGEPQSKWKHQLRMTWNTPWNLSASLNWRYLSPVKLDVNTSNPFLASNGIGFLDTIDGRIPSYSYFDFSMTYRLKDRYTFRAGINNLFDKDPPVLDANNVGIAGTTGFGNGNTFPGVYDSIGRSVFLGVTADF